MASELAFWCLMAVLRSGAGGVGGGCAVEGGLVFGLGGSGCRWAEVGLGGGLLARAYFSSSFLFDILGAGASGPGADTRIGSESHDTPCALRHASTPLHDFLGVPSGSASRRSTAMLMDSAPRSEGG